MTLLFEIPGGFEWIIIVFFILGIFIIPLIFYLITLQSTLELISAENRKMPAAQVWLLFIPLFNLVWHFIIINKLADSIEAEAKKNNLSIENRPGYNIGLAMCILGCLTIIPYLGFVVGLAFLVCWIVYWVKIASFKRLFTVATITQN